MKRNIERRQAVERDLRRWFASHGSVVSRRQALALGLTASQIRQRVVDGRWWTRHRGVYVLAGTAPGPRQEIWAALAALPPSARPLVSHQSAAWLWGWSERPPDRVQLLVPANFDAQLEGVDVHRSRVPAEAARRLGFPCTSAIRTLVDCAAVVAPSELVDLLDRSLASKAITVASLYRSLQPVPAPRRMPAQLPGRAVLLQCLEQRGMLGGPAPSVLESRTARLFHHYGLDGLAAEVVWGPNGEYRVDFADLELRLIIEVEGYTWHSSPRQHQRDAQRRRQMSLAGWLVLSYTWMDISYDGDAAAVEVVRARERLRRGDAA